ncbi:MAG: Folylpolyglutamate synthetase [Vezdaea aestivalis]|nr:MAG: Folylpolyglutamate synthetase [Vezdaea aestivalis]
MPELVSGKTDGNKQLPGRQRHQLPRVSLTLAQEAISKLNSLQTPFDVLEQRSDLGLSKKESGLDEMRGWLRRIGHKIYEIDRLNIVHVAGTKGKGSTCAFVESIFAHVQSETNRPAKYGLYTSPHLITVRERIRINSQPLGTEDFTRYFFEVWDLLESSALKNGLSLSDKPNYFRFLTLLSFHVFIVEKVNTAIYEVGIGGAWDSTNIIERPTVTGITKLGIDHVRTLGDTIEQISWHKAGIFKERRPAYSVPQIPQAIPILEQRAKDCGVTLQVVKVPTEMGTVKITPDAEYQRENATLALNLANVALRQMDCTAVITPTGISNTAKLALETTVWPGRCEVKKFKGNTWYLDGAHTMDSINVASHWYSGIVQAKNGLNILIFNQQKRPEAVTFLSNIREIMKNNNVRFGRVIFCSDITRQDGKYDAELQNNNRNPEEIRSLTVQKGFAKAWIDMSVDADKRLLSKGREEKKKKKKGKKKEKKER